MSFSSPLCSKKDKEESNIRRHVLNAFREGELERDENNVHFLHVNGVKKPVPFYSLDVIISVGYRVKSKRGTAFRIWARKILKEYLIKGYAVNERIRKEQIGELRQLVGMLALRLHGKSLQRDNKQSQRCQQSMLRHLFKATFDNRMGIRKFQRLKF